MSTAVFKNNLLKPALLFALGFFLMMLTMWVPFIPAWNTFIHMWRVELAAAIFLILAVFYILYVSAGRQTEIDISHEELKFIVLPILAFISWSAISMAWAPSWKSALHHTLVWAAYLIFYLIVRQLIDHGRSYRVMATMFAITFVLFSLPAIVDYCLFLIFGGGTMVGMRFAKYGEPVNTIFPLLLVGVLRLSGRRFTLGLLVLSVIWLLIFCSLGRINLFLFVCGTVAVAACVFVFKRFHRYRRKVLVALGVLAFAPLPLHVFTLFSDDANIPMVRRVSDEAGISSSNNFRKLMTTLSLEMFETHPLIGIGADNFGMQVHKYRSAYGEKNPDDVNLAVAENELPERAHNEYLQILAELGVVGGLIFVWFLAGLVLMAFKVLRKKTPLMAFAAVLGIGLFLISSLVSSYSFRFIQNGFVFFFVLAVAAKFLLKPKKGEAKRITVSAARMRFACGFGIAACLLLAAYSTVRVSSVYFAEKANRVENLDEAIPLYQTAFRLDDENPNAHFYLGNRLSHDGQYSKAASHLEQAVEMGQGASSTYSRLATAYLMSGDSAAAERTFANAVKLYPRSAFVLTRYAFFLNINGKAAESAHQLDRALMIDNGAANTWWTIMNEGTEQATRNALKDSKLRPIMDLRPQEAIYVVIAERELRFPAEKKKLPF